MRTAILLLLTASLLGGGFVLYWKYQPLSPRLAGDDGTGGQPMGLNPDDPSVQGVGAGQRPWFKVFDKEGRLSSRFRAGVYQPRNDGTVVVKNVEAEFYQYPRPKPGEPQQIQLVKIDGSDGEVVAQQVPKMTPTPAGPPAPGKRSEKTAGAPRRGRLNNVVVRLFPDAGKLFPDAGNPNADKPKPSLTLTTNNVAFDNESFEIVTESYRDQNGDVVPADEVPVVVTGDDDGYDFAGRGLKVRWNDVDGRLELLEIAHGDYLRIKKPGKLASGAGRGKGALAADLDSGPLRDPVTGVPVMLATAQKGAPKGAQTRPVRQQPPYRATFDENVRVSQEVSKGEEMQVALADIMNVEFMLAQDKPATQPTTRPTTRPSTAPASPATVPATPAGPTTEPAEPTTRPATPAEEVQPIIVRWTGKLQVMPIEPTDAERAPGLTPGESVLRLVGNSAPVRLTHELNKVVCAAMDYYTSDGSLLVRNSPKFPQVTLTQAGNPATRPSTGSGQGPTTMPDRPVPDAALVVTESIVYSGSERVALLGGRSHAQILLNPDDPGAGVPPGAAPEMMDARWNRTGRLYFAQTPATRPAAGKAAAGSGLRLDRARFEGDVDVKHPQLALRSQALELAFDPVPASPAPLASPERSRGASPERSQGARPVLTAGKTGASKPDGRDEPQVQLRRLLASDGVVCDLKDDHGKPQTLACQQLTLETALTPDGKSYPRKVIADGDAHAFDAEQDVKAGQIEIYLIPARKPAPATRPTTGPAIALATDPTTAPTTAPTSRPSSKLDPPAIELQALTARKNVRIASLDGGSVLADEMYVLMKQDQPHVRLVGAPEAKVVDAKGNTVVGPFIAIDPEQDVARIEGAGWMEVLRQETPDSAPRPMKVTWKNGAEVNGPKNVVDVRGPVRVTTTDADGAYTTASANDIRIDLTDAPPPPATQPTTRKSKGPTTGPSTRPAERDTGITAGMNVDFLRDKVMRAITLERNADVRSTLSDADGGVLREFNLRSNDRIRYELTGGARPGSPQATGDPRQQKGRLVVPGAGQMLVRDHRPPPAPATRPVAAKAGAGAAQPAAAKSPAQDAASRRGASAFQWQKDMSYDEATQMAVMNGDVTVVHRSDDPKDPPARLNADQVVAVFEPRKDLKPSTKPSTRPTTGPATRPAGMMDQAVPLQLKWLTARGNLSVTRGGAMLTAARIDYNPLTQWMTAVGDGRTPAVYTDSTGATTFADELWWNIETWKVKVKEGGSRTGSPR